MTESELISRCRKKDRVAQEQLFRLHSGSMMGICVRYSRDRDEARDLLHDGFIKVFTSIESFRGDSAVKTWMSRIFVNTCLSHLKDKYKKYRLIDEDEDFAAEEEEVDDSILNEISSEEALEMVQQLPDKYRLIINMYSIDGYTHKMIAGHLGISEGTSKSQLSRARQLLLKTIELKRKKNEKARK